MNYLKDKNDILKLLSSGNDTFIHLYSDQTQSTSKDFNAIRSISRDLIKEHSFGGICFEIESMDIYGSSLDLGEDCYLPIIKSEIGDDLEDVYDQALTDFLVPSKLGALICTVDRPFLAYKSLFLFPHFRCRFDYIIVYHGWGELRGSRYPFMDIFNKFNYIISYKDDFIYIAKRSY